MKTVDVKIYSFFLLFSQEFHTKDTKEEKITKEERSRGCRTKVMREVYDKIADKNPFFPLCVLFFLRVLCEISWRISLFNSFAETFRQIVVADVSDNPAALITVFSRAYAGVCLEFL